MLTLVERVLLLADVPLFAETRTADLAHLAAVARESEVARGEVVQAAGDPPDAMHVIITGRLRLERPGRTAELGKGETFGAWALFDQSPRLFSATALEPTRLLSVDRDGFVDVISDHVNVSRGVMRVLAGRIRKRAMEKGADGREDIEIG